MAVTTTLILQLLAAVVTLGTIVVGQNPLVGHPLYVNPSYVAELDQSIATAEGTTKTTLESMRSVSSAYWLDVKSKVQPGSTNTTTAAGILADALKQSPVPLVTLIVYDLPNRDCHAHASNGEICCTTNSDGTCDYTAAGDCSDGISEYQDEYIKPLSTVLASFCGKVPIALIIEPDSLPNLATNMGDPRCGNAATVAAYEQGIPYAVTTLAAACPSATRYLDAAHGGWLGWSNNIDAFVQKVSAMEISQHLRGFSTNVANYQPLGIQCQQTSWCLNGQHQSDPCCADPCKLESQYNPANNEHNFVAELAATAQKQMSFSPHFVIDTGRNGVDGMRGDCANWCNIRGAGVGTYPTTNVANTSLIDAYLWLKTPGESDGCTQTLPGGGQCARYDSMCGSKDSIGSLTNEPNAPEAGKWFDYEVKMLASNANMGPNPSPSPPSPTPPPPPPSPPPPSPPPSPPTPPPLPPPPSPPPNPDCPGGSLEACMALCPSSPPAAYKACVADCVKRCPTAAAALIARQQ